jgi:hypothetical protein
LRRGAISFIIASVMDSSIIASVMRQGLKPVRALNLAAFA